MEGSLHVKEAKKLNDNVPESQEADAIERIIQEVGEMGTYQKLLFLAMMPFFMTFVGVYSMQMFISATPQQHWCRVPELQHLNIDLRRNLSIPGAAQGLDWNRCSVYDANWTEVLQTMSPPLNTTLTKPCQHGWEFLFDDIPYETVVSEREWVCDRAGNAPLAQSVFFGGSLVGCAFFGWAGDKFGRLPALIGSNLIGCLGGVLFVLTQGVWDFVVASFLLGLANDSCVLMICLIGMVDLETLSLRRKMLIRVHYLSTLHNKIEDHCVLGALNILVPGRLSWVNSGMVTPHLVAPAYLLDRRRAL